MQSKLSLLRDSISRQFSLSELGLLAFDLGLTLDNIQGDTQETKAQALVEYFDRRNDLQTLLKRCAILRGNYDWGQFLDTAGWQKILDQPRKSIVEVESALCEVRYLLYDLAVPASFRQLEIVLKNLSNLRDAMLRSTLGAASNERAGDYESALRTYRSALMRGYEVIIDDMTGDPIQTREAIGRITIFYGEDIKGRVADRILAAQHAVSRGFKNASRERIENARSLLLHASQTIPDFDLSREIKRLDEFVEANNL